MELSVRRRAPAVQHVMPVLRVLPADRLLLHEEADPVRVRRLQDALRRDGVLRNPPIAAPAPDGRAVVLDGANRTSALRALGLPHAVVQLVPYGDPRIALSVWCHYVNEGTAGALRGAAKAARIARVQAVADEGEAQARVAAREGVAAVIDAEGGVVLQTGAVETAPVLRRLTALYRDGRLVHRIEAGGLDELRALYGPGALVLFRPFDKSDIFDLAIGGERLPAGITRHVIPGRALRLNTPLDWLEDRIEPAVKQAALDALLQQRWQAHGVRYYAEPTFLFDE